MTRDPTSRPCGPTSRISTSSSVPATRSPTSTPVRPRASRVRRPTHRSCRPNATSDSPNCRRCCTRTAAPATPGRYCWCSRAWIPRARVASSNTLWEQVIHRASDIRASASRPRKSWRITTCGASADALPTAGHIGVFDRSHYEDVLIVRVHNLVAPDVWGARYDEINAFEKALVDDGMTLIKVAMFVSLDEQKAATGRAAGAAGQVLEVQPRRRRRTAEVAAVPGGVPGAARQDVDRLRAMACDSVRPQVVQQTGHHRTADRSARRARLVLATGRFRCRSGEEAASAGLVSPSSACPSRVGI